MFVVWLIHTRWFMWHDSFIHTFIYLTCLMDVCDVTQSCKWRDPLMYLTWLIHNSMRHDSFIYKPSHMDVCIMAHSYIWLYAFMYVNWLIHTYDMTLWHMWDYLFIYMTWLMDVRSITHSYIWHYALMNVIWLIHTYDMTHWHMWDVSFINMIWPIFVCDMTHSYIWHDSLMYERWFPRHQPRRHPSLFIAGVGDMGSGRAAAPFVQQSRAAGVEALSRVLGEGLMARAYMCGVTPRDGAAGRHSHLRFNHNGVQWDLKQVSLILPFQSDGRTRKCKICPPRWVKDGFPTHWFDIK